MMKLKIKVLEEAGIIEPTKEDVERFEKCDFLTINRGKDGNEYIWYLDSDNMEAAMCIETGVFLTQSEIERILEW